MYSRFRVEMTKHACILLWAVVLLSYWSRWNDSRPPSAGVTWTCGEANLAWTQQKWLLVIGSGFVDDLNNLKDTKRSELKAGTQGLDPALRRQ